ncbi:MAG: DegT/DnrJ/EryC1/StrS family aminotransferase [Magnetococcales bacterium]|nr:DegT/DnrJ/EryC1/StrS family aminotransferase [Magnetococcales bacterium]
MEAVERVLSRGDFIKGEELSLFEAEFAAFSGVAHAIGCASGTDALHLGLRALGVQPGDEVIMPAMTFVATALGITLTGARPVLVDVDPETGLIDPDAVRRAITPRTRAILPVHLFGQCAAMDVLAGIATERGLWLVEDAAQAHGARHGERRAGSMGVVGCFSFFPGKNLGAFGDGGLVTTNDPALADRIALLGNWGSRRKYHHEEMGFNSRLDTLQAAFLRIKLRHLDEGNAARRRHAQRYDEALGDLPHIRLTRHDAGSIYHLYVIRTPARDEVLARLHAEGIQAGVHYPFAVHQLQAYRWLGHVTGDFPVAEDWARHSLSLPIYPELPEDTAQRVARLLSTHP